MANEDKTTTALVADDNRSATTDIATTGVDRTMRQQLGLAKTMADIGRFTDEQIQQANKKIELLLSDISLRQDELQIGWEKVQVLERKIELAKMQVDEERNLIVSMECWKDTYFKDECVLPANTVVKRKRDDDTPLSSPAKIAKE